MGEDEAKGKIIRAVLTMVDNRDWSPFVGGEEAARERSAAYEAARDLFNTSLDAYVDARIYKATGTRP